MSQQAAKRRRKQFSIGFRHVAPGQRMFSGCVPNSAVRHSARGSGAKKKA